MELVVATRNQDKLREIRKLLKDLPLKVISLNNFRHVPEVREDGRTLEANAKKKALRISGFLNKLAIADDSGLEIPFLGNRPGVYSARFSGKGATYASNNEKVLRLLKDAPVKNRKACFRCVIAVADRGKLVSTVEGRCNGRIILEPKGKSGFGYDPIFIPNGHKKTFAQIGIKRKNKISHRGKALIKAKTVVKKYIHI